MAGPTALSIGGVDAVLRLPDGDGVETIVEQVPEEGGPTATVKFRVPWASRYQFLRGLAGYATANGTSIVRVPRTANCRRDRFDRLPRDSSKHWRFARSRAGISLMPTPLIRCPS